MKRSRQNNGFFWLLSIPLSMPQLSMNFPPLWAVPTKNVKQIALKLQQKGYAEIETDPDDRRKSRVRLGRKAESLQSAYALKEEAFMDLLYKDISETQLKTALETLNTMMKNMEECNI